MLNAKYVEFETRLFVKKDRSRQTERGHIQTKTPSACLLLYTIFQ